MINHLSAPQGIIPGGFSPGAFFCSPAMASDNLEQYRNLVAKSDLPDPVSFRAEGIVRAVNGQRLTRRHDAVVLQIVPG